MSAKYYEIMGQAYTDMLKTATGKALTCLSQELGYNETYLRKSVQEGNRIRIGVANQIEAIYGISVSPYIIQQPKQAEDSPVDVTVTLEEMMDVLRKAILVYLEEKYAASGAVNEK